MNDFNLKLKNGNATTFMINPLGNPLYPLNMSMTEAPLMNGAENLVDLHFDGLFFDSPAATTHVTANQVFPARNAGSHSE